MYKKNRKSKHTDTVNMSESIILFCALVMKRKMSFKSQHQKEYDTWEKNVQKHNYKTSTLKTKLQIQIKEHLNGEIHSDYEL